MRVADYTARPERKKTMDYIATNDAPKAIGPYSQAVRNGSLLFLSGQIPLDPATGELVQGDFAAQTRRVFENLSAVLTAAGASFANVTRATVYLTDLGNFQTLNGIYAEYFGDHKPARSTVGVASLPKGATVEIDLIAMV
jgi:2-iminobutanoate/2-iminopropanoate deaminase